MPRFFDWDAYLADGPAVDIPPALDPDLTAPMPYFGGKRRAAELIWERLGDVTNYVEAFGGSFAVGLARPAWHRARVETCNDLDGLLVNFWRAVAADPLGVADVCDWPVTEVDLFARHKVLVEARAGLSKRLEASPKFYDVELAGWWVWGASCWIGDGWCRAGCDGAPRPRQGNGIHGVAMREPAKRMPDIGGGRHWNGVDMQARPGKGIHREAMREPARQLPDLGGSTKGEATFPNAGKGVHAGGMRVQQKMPHLGGDHDHGRGVCSIERRTALHATFTRLAARLRYVRFPCGDYQRVLTPAVTWRHGLTGILLDPTYDEGEINYSVGGRISSEVRAWCIEHADDRLPNGDPAYRIALCGYEGEHDELEALGWECVAWKARGGYGNQRKDGENENARRERIWFSPACLKVRAAPPAEQLSLLG
jgi:DNA adenine methylase